MTDKEKLSIIHREPRNILGGAIENFVTIKGKELFLPEGQEGSPEGFENRRFAYNPGSLLEKLDINAIFEKAKKDPSLFSTLDIENLLESVDNVKNDYLENKSMADINQEIYDCISELGLDTEIIENLCKKLIGYRYVDRISELHKGKHMRWLRIINSSTGKAVPIQEIKLTAGGILTNVEFLDNGTHVRCMGPGNRFIQYKFDDCLTFQKLTVEEQLILMASG